MHRIDTSTAQVDKFGSGKNGFTGGNPQTGVLPTALDADYFDTLQEELAGVIEAAGITLNKSSNSQLTAAIKALVGPGRLLGPPIVIAVTGTYIPTAGTKKIKVRGVGGGGAGGGVGIAVSSGVRAGGGAGSGTYGELWLTNVPASVPCTIGSAGVGVNGNDGGNGGDTVFGSYMTLPGGKGGLLGISLTGAAKAAIGGGVADAATGATVSVRGMKGADSYAVSSTTVIAGAGSSNPLGVGASESCSTSTTSTAFSVAGSPGYGFGSGGGGAMCGIGGAANIGGSGCQGILIIEEYA
jgi:hypothetical protein